MGISLSVLSTRSPLLSGSIRENFLDCYYGMNGVVEHQSLGFQKWVWVSRKFHRAMIPYRNADGSLSCLVRIRLVKTRSNDYINCASSLVADKTCQYLLAVFS